jgi:hypothetical protein
MGRRCIKTFVDEQRSDAEPSAEERVATLATSWFSEHPSAEPVLLDSYKLIRDNFFEMFWCALTRRPYARTINITLTIIYEYAETGGVPCRL